MNGGRHDAKAWAQPTLHHTMPHTKHAPPAPRRPRDCVFRNFQGRCFPNFLALAQDQKSLSLGRAEVSEVLRAEEYLGRGEP